MTIYFSIKNDTWISIRNTRLLILMVMVGLIRSLTMIVVGLYNGLEPATEIVTTVLAVATNEANERTIVIASNRPS